MGGVESTHGIGAVARASGLSVSALRFYDGAGVLAPAHVDPRTGYRRYTSDQVAVARLVAALRRVGMPLSRIRQVLAHRHDPAAVDALLDAHLRRLERGLDDARRELSSVPALLSPEEPAMTRTVATVPAAALAAAVRAVRFAVDPLPRFPVLGGVLLDVGASAVTVVATDRYRLAVASAPVRVLDGPAVPAVVPAAFAAALLGLDGPGEVEIAVDGTTATAAAGTRRETTELIDEPFPDYARLLPAGADRMGADAVRTGTRVEIGADELRAAVAAGGTRTVHRAEDGVDTPVTVLAVDGDGRLAVGADLPDGVGVNAEFLLEAVAAAGSDQLVLHLDDLLNPVLLRPVAAGAFSLLMPVRL